MIDTLYRDIEQLALEQLTVAGITAPEDLRYLVAVLRMLPDLERNGDLAEHVARRAVRGLGVELSPRSRGLVERMGEVAIHMWRATADAYAERAPDVADAGRRPRRRARRPPRHPHRRDRRPARCRCPVAVELALVARFYERFGDHAVNLARRIAVLAGRAADRPSRTGATPAAGPAPAPVRRRRRGAPAPRRSARR